VIAAGLLVLLGFVGLLQVMSGGDETAQAGGADPAQVAEAAETPTAGTTASGEVSQPASEPATPATPQDEPGAAFDDPVPQLPTVDGVAAAQSVYTVEPITQQQVPTGPDALPSGILEPAPPANPVPGMVIAPLDQGLTMPATNPIPVEGVSMGQAEPIPGAASYNPLPQDVTSDSAMTIVDQGIGKNRQGETYIVKPGDSLSKISNEVDVEMYDLAIWNELERPNDLQVGQVLHLYERPGIRKVNPQWVTPKKKPAAVPEPVDVAPAPAPAPPPPPAPVVEEEKKGFIGRFVDKINRIQRDKKDELREERGE
jgi:LysM repeat protein